jgi:hypothetical protein
MAQQVLEQDLQRKWEACHMAFAHGVQPEYLVLGVSDLEDGLGVNRSRHCRSPFRIGFSGRGIDRDESSHQQNAEWWCMQTNGQAAAAANYSG